MELLHRLVRAHVTAAQSTFRGAHSSVAKVVEDACDELIVFANAQLVESARKRALMDESVRARNRPSPMKRKTRLDNLIVFGSSYSCAGFNSKPQEHGQ